MIDNTYLNFTDSSANTTNGTGNKIANGAESIAVIGLRRLVLAVGISVLTLIGLLRDVFTNPQV
jgi:hypothetical protein